jgi:hypothetical protein
VTVRGEWRARSLVAKIWRALFVANVRYWPTVWPVVQRELRHWERHAGAIPAAEARELALAKLHEEGFNAEVAATLATLTPAAHRANATTAIVALQLLYDYLDGCSEAAAAEPLGVGRRVFEVMLGALGEPAAGEGHHRPLRGDTYAAELGAAVRGALARLPGCGSHAALAQRTARLCAEAQLRVHAIPQLGVEQVREWARGAAKPFSLGWRELEAGAASSILAIHALIAQSPVGLRADEAERTVQTYLRICAVISLLDSVVDHDADARAGTNGFLELYEEPAALGPILCQLSDEAVAYARPLRYGPHHLMTLTGAVAYWATAPGAKGTLAGPIMRELRRHTRPAIAPALGVMLAWRRAKGTRAAISLVRR